MVSLKDQMLAAAKHGGIEASFFVARLLTPLGVSYEAAEKIFSPYSEIKAINPAMRNDVLTLIKRAVGLNKRVFVTANNKAEGNSALTMASIGGLLSEIVANSFRKIGP